MSLQKLPASLTPKSVEKSYRVRRWEYTTQRLKEHNKVEQSAGLLGAIVTGALAGAAWGALYGLLGFLAALFTILLIHYWQAPRALYEKSQEQLKATQRLLLEEVPKRINEIEWLSEKVGFWRFLETQCYMGNLPDELKKIARNMEGTTINHLKGEARTRLKEWLADIAETSADPSRITVILNFLNDAIAEQEHISQLDAIAKGNVNS